jgi:hypothetical protein
MMTNESARIPGVPAGLLLCADADLDDQGCGVRPVEAGEPNAGATIVASKTHFGGDLNGDPFYQRSRMSTLRRTGFIAATS